MELPNCRLTQITHEILKQFSLKEPRSRSWHVAVKRLGITSLVIMASVATDTSFSKQTTMNENSAPQPWPQIQNSRNYNTFAFGEFIYWRFSSPNLVYGRDGVSTTLSDPQVEKVGKSYYPQYDYDPGFRTGVGVKFGPEKAFDLVAVYTRLHTKSSGRVSSNQFSGQFIPLNWFSGSTAANTFTFGSLELDLFFNWIEAQSGYTFKVNPYLAIRPYIALTSYIINGDLDARYNYRDAMGFANFSQTHGNSDSWSIGPKVGVDFVTHITPKFGLFTNINITQQISHIKMTTLEFIRTPAKGSVFVGQKGNVIKNDNFSYIGMEIGPTWDAWFAHKKYHVQLRTTFTASNLISGTNLSFLNNNNQDLLVTSEFRGVNIRGTFEF